MFYLKSGFIEYVYSFNVIVIDLINWGFNLKVIDDLKVVFFIWLISIVFSVCIN